MTLILDIVMFFCQILVNRNYVMFDVIFYIEIFCDINEFSVIYFKSKFSDILNKLIIKRYYKNVKHSILYKKTRKPKKKK